MNIGILLAAGKSTRFGEVKQFYKINGKRIIDYSIDALTNVVDFLIIITDVDGYSQVIIPKGTNSSISKGIVLISHGDRNDSIQVGLDYLNQFMNVGKVIIHDSARPFVTKSHFERLLNYPFAQYYLRLTNGLYNLTTSKTVPRDSYIELCTPVCLTFNSIKGKLYTEFINFFHFELIESSYSILRKITVFSDI